MDQAGRTDADPAPAARSTGRRQAASSVPPRASAHGTRATQVGVGLKALHYRTILESRPTLGFFEIHAENYMGAGGPPHRYLEAIRANYKLSIHGVGLSLGGAAPLDVAHLRRLRALIDRYQPDWFSEHLAWSVQDGAYLNDLLPIPYTDDALAHVCDRIDQVQAALGRPMLLENPSTYVSYRDSAIAEPDFLAAIAARTGCGLLLDVNNVAVSATNHGFDPFAYLDRFPAARVGEIHLAGYASSQDARGNPLLIDAHGSAVAADVWRLYRHAVARTGPVATLIEWDNDVPEWSVLYAEAQMAAACARICPPEDRHVARTR
ncbi:MAG: DUF692 domain-containing protein [Alphaproteobacteria bacterium]